MAYHVLQARWSHVILVYPQFYPNISAISNHLPLLLSTINYYSSFIALQQPRVVLFILYILFMGYLYLSLYSPWTQAEISKAGRKLIGILVLKYSS